MENALNLCEILNPERAAIKPAMDRLGGEYDRIYLGSSFCSRYFRHLEPQLKSLFDEAQALGLPITLTLPVFSQKDLDWAKEKITELIKHGAVDEVTVNDVGMKRFLKEKSRINLGRLFFKDPRDIRIPELYNGTSRPAGLDFAGEELCEIDPISKSLELDRPVALHYPYCYLTTGNICKFASINKDEVLKFRPNAPCLFECQRIHEYFTEDFGDGKRELFRFGRTVYYLNDDIDPVDENVVRLIHFPLKELSLT